MEGQGLVTAAPSVDGFWDVYSRYYDAVNQLMPYRKLLWDALEALELQPGMRVLDAGCGTGNFELFMEEKGAPQVRVDAIDFSPGMLATAAWKCRGLADVEFRSADLNERLPYADATFDRVVSVNVLYTLKDWRHTMREFTRVLRPEGRVVVTSTMPGLRHGPLVREHFRRVGNVWGFSRKAGVVLDTFKMLPTGVGAGIANVFVIDRREKQGLYRSFEPDELRRFFDRECLDGGLGNYAIWPALANQNLMAAATMRAAGPPE
jgi:ubiquinone/menaquinone biosynthesis C-methylase UbiE